jgi:hypothetical protein
MYYKGGEISRMKSGGKACGLLASSFVMCPHPNDFHNAVVFENLVDEPMLDIDPSGIRSSQITNELFVPRRSLKGIYFENLEEFFSLGSQSSCSEFLGVLLSLFRVNKRPFHQESSGEHFSTGVFKPRTIDSRILGMESRYNVSWIARQSSIEMRTPAFFFPTMWIGSWDFSDSARSFSDTLAFRASTVFIRFSSIELVLI